MTISFTRAVRPLAAALLGASLLAACGGSDDNLDDRLGVAEPKLRFVYVAPSGPPVSLYRNDEKQADASNAHFMFGSRYFNVARGGATWAVKTEGTAPATSLGSVSIDAQKGEKYTIVALPSGAATSLDLLLIDDPYDKGLASSKARLRFVNAAPEPGSIDIYVTSPTTDIATVQPIYSQVTYKSASPASGADSFETDGGTYLVRVTRVGSKEVIFSKPLKVDSNADWLLSVIPPDAGATAPRLLLVRADDQNASQPTVELFTTD